MAAYARRQFAGGSIVTTVPLLIGVNDASFTLAASTNWPDGSVGPFVIVLDFGNSTQEKVLCQSRTGLVVTVAASGRGYDGTSAVQHSAGCSAQVVHCAQDDDEANQVVAAVLGQANAAKGDILYMLSAAGPNTLQRLAVGSNGSLLSAASAVPAYTAAGTSGQSLISAGSAVPTWSTRGTNAFAGPGSGSTASASFANLSSVSTAVTITTGTQVKITLTGSLVIAATSPAGYLGFAISGATTQAASVPLSLEYNAFANPSGTLTSVVFPQTITAGSNTFTIQASVTSSATMTLSQCYIIVECLN